MTVHLWKKERSIFDMKNILEKLRSDFEYLTGENYTGLVRAIGMGFASRLSEFSSKLRFIEKQAFAATADQDYLYLHSGQLVPPMAKGIAKGQVIFTGLFGESLLIGIELTDGKNTYITTSGGGITRTVIPIRALTVKDGVVTASCPYYTPTEIMVDGETIPVSVVNEIMTFESTKYSAIKDVPGEVSAVMSPPINIIAKEAGGNANRDRGYTLKTTTTIPGVDSLCKVESLSGGTDPQTIEQYREEVLHFLANPQAPFNVANIIDSVVKAVPSVKGRVWVKGGEVVEGTVVVYAINSTFTLSASEITNIRSVVEGMRPAQMRPENIAVMQPEVADIEVIIKDLSPSDDTMKDEVTKNIKSLFSTDLFEKAITKQNIESVVYRTTNGKQRVQSFSVAKGWVTVANGVFCKLSDVKFT